MKKYFEFHRGSTHIDVTIPPAMPGTLRLMWYGVRERLLVASKLAWIAMKMAAVTWLYLALLRGWQGGLVEITVAYLFAMAACLGLP